MVFRSWFMKIILLNFLNSCWQKSGRDQIRTLLPTLSEDLDQVKILVEIRMASQAPRVAPPSSVGGRNGHNGLTVPVFRARPQLKQAACP